MSPERRFSRISTNTLTFKSPAPYSPLHTPTHGQFVLPEHREGMPPPPAADLMDFPTIPWSDIGPHLMSADAGPNPFTHPEYVELSPGDGGPGIPVGWGAEAIFNQDETGATVEFKFIDPLTIAREWGTRDEEPEEPVEPEPVEPVVKPEPEEDKGALELTQDAARALNNFSLSQRGASRVPKKAPYKGRIPETLSGMPEPIARPEGCFQCPLCPKEFKLRKHCRRHMVVHGNARPFKCRVCQAGFYRQDSMQRHMFHCLNEQ